MTEDWPFQCETCGEYFSTQEAYDKHWRELNELFEGKITAEEYMKRVQDG